MSTLRGGAFSVVTGDVKCWTTGGLMAIKPREAGYLNLTQPTPITPRVGTAFLNFVRKNGAACSACSPRKSGPSPQR